MSNTTIEISNAGNGLILRYPSEMPEVREQDVEVFQFNEAPDGGCAESPAYKEMFLRILEILGHPYDKFGADNLTIESNQFGHKHTSFVE